MGRAVYRRQVLPDNEFVFVWFFNQWIPGRFHAINREIPMFVFDRSAAAVLVPIALLIAVVWWSGRSPSPELEAARPAPADQVSTLARADAPQVQGS
jgi:hypothetical protein